MNTNSRTANIVAFRDFLRARFPEAHASMQVPEAAAALSPVFGLEVLDLCKGAITEVVAPSLSCGAGLLLNELLQHEKTCREFTALVDGCDAFDPWSLESSALERMLWVRCREPAQAVRATDLLLRDGNIPLVILDLQSHPARAVQSLPSSSWHRLRMLAEKSGCSLCAFTPVRTVTCARTRVRLTQRFDLSDQDKDRATLLSALSLQVDRQRAKVPLSEPVRATA